MKKVLLVLSVALLSLNVNSQSVTPPINVDCSKLITVDYDEFEDRYTYATYNLGFEYLMMRVQDRYYLRVTAGTYGLHAIGKKGLTLMLKDGTRLSWSEAELDTEVAEEGPYDYEVKAFVRLSESQLNKVSESNPYKAKLYVYTTEFRNKDYTTAFKCIMSK